MGIAKTTDAVKVTPSMAAVERKPYQPPKLECFGAVTALTQAGSLTGNESGSMGTCLGTMVMQNVCNP